MKKFVSIHKKLKKLDKLEEGQARLGEMLDKMRKQYEGDIQNLITEIRQAFEHITEHFQALHNYGNRLANLECGQRLAAA